MKGDEFWMAEAIRIAQQGCYTTTPNPNVGCVIVKDNVLIGSGFHQYAGGPHAEVHALSQAKGEAVGATAYVTLEPCSHFGKTPPCANALIEAGITRVVIAMLDPNPLVAGRGLAKLEAAGIETQHSVLSSSAESLNPGFLKRMRTGRPFIQVKMAASLDGATAMASGESQWITGPQARQDVQEFRAQACAIVTGVGTVIADDPSLTVRIDGASRQPLRIILDPSGRTPLTAKMLSLTGRTLIVVGEQIDASRQQELESAGFEVLRLPLIGQRIDLAAFLDWAGTQQLNTLWVEAGATLAGAFIAQGLFDEVIYYQAPLFLGDNTRSVIGQTFATLADGISFNVTDTRFVGKDLRWRLLKS